MVTIYGDYNSYFRSAINLFGYRKILFNLATSEFLPTPGRSIEG